MKFAKTFGFQVLGTVLLAAGAAISARADYQATVLSQGPVGYWRLNETTQPQPAAPAANLGSLGASANGSYNNYPVRGVAGPFAGSSAVGFSGSSSVTTPWQVDLNPNAFSAEFWVNPSVVPNFAYVLSSVTISNPRSGWYMAQDSGGTFGAGSAFVVRMFNQNGNTPTVQLAAPVNEPAGTWYHIVLTFDGTTAALYQNGVMVTNHAAAQVPNVSGQFSVGVRSDNGFPFSGKAAEVALYSGALSAAQVAAHYTAATSAPATYATTVQGDSPLLYWRFTEPADPVAANSGTDGSALDGIYVYNAKPGVAGPQPPTLPGFDALNDAVSFDGVGGGVVQIPGMNLSANTVTITTWIKAVGSQVPATGLIFSRSGNTVAGLNIDATSAGLGLGYTWNDDPNTYNWSPSRDAGLPALPDSQWAFAALVVKPEQAAIFLGDPANPTAYTGVTNILAHPSQDFSGVTLFGADAGFTPARFLNGSMDEVAIFNRSLTEGEVFTQFATGVGGLAPKIFLDPQSPPDTVYAGDSLTLTVDAGGTAPLGYQWRKGGTPIGGATDASYTIPILTTDDAGSYDVVVSNGSGSATSQPASFTVATMSAPTITQDIQGRTIYPGGTLNLTVVASGGALHYQWQKDDAPIADATNATYLVQSVTSADGGAYKVVITNKINTATSATANITVVTPATGSYAASVVADGPEAWYRLDETTGASVMYDAMARHDGQYVNTVTLGVPGIVSGDPDTAASFDGSESYGSVPYSADLNTAEITIEVWAKTTVLDNTSLCPVSSRSAVKGYWFYTYPSGSWSGGVSSGGNNYYVPTDSPEKTILPDQWTYLVMTVGTGTLRYYVNGQWDGQGYVDFNRNAAGPMLIGARGVNAGTADMFFQGQVDEVAVYKRPLTAAQIKAHYEARFGTTTKPYITQQPRPATAVVGTSASFTGRAQGSSPLGYQWYKDGAPISGATSTTLSLSNVQYTDIATYKLAVTNAAGSVDSDGALLTVVPPIAFANATNGLVLHLKFDDDYADSSGHGNNGTAVGAPTFVAGMFGSALRYETSGGGASADYVTLGSPADLSFGASTSFSVGFWVKMPSANYLSGDLPFLCSATGSYSNPGFTFAPSYKLGGWSWSLGYGSSWTGLYGPDGSINDGQWHHLLHSFDRAAGTGTTYLDGAEVDVTSIANVGDIDTAGPVNIGQDPTGAYSEDGVAILDDLGVWRRALTASEAYAIWYSGANFGATFDQYGPVTMALVKSSSNDLLIIWQAGTLLEAPSADGPWTPVAGATPPNYKVTPGAGNKFYKVQL